MPGDAPGPHHLIKGRVQKEKEERQQGGDGLGEEPGESDSGVYLTNAGDTPSYLFCFFLLFKNSTKTTSAS